MHVSVSAQQFASLYYHHIGAWMNMVDEADLAPVKHKVCTNYVTAAISEVKTVSSIFNKPCSKHLDFWKFFFFFCEIWIFQGSTASICTFRGLMGCGVVILGSNF